MLDYCGEEFGRVYGAAVTRLVSTIRGPFRDAVARAGLDKVLKGNTRFGETSGLQMECGVCAAFEG
jgi:hypothetical protein